MPNSEVEMQMHVNNSLLLLVIRVETDKVLYLLLDRNIPFYDKLRGTLENIYPVWLNFSRVG